MEITLLNPDIAELKKVGNNYVIDYGEKKQYSDLSVKLKVETKEQLFFHVTCGCTTTDKTDKSYGYDITLKYDAKNKGNFAKTVRVVANKKAISEITLKGTIK